MPLSEKDSAYADLTTVKLEIEGFLEGMNTFVKRYEADLNKDEVFPGSLMAGKMANAYEVSLTKYDELCAKYGELANAYIDAGGAEPEYSPPSPPTLSDSGTDKHLAIRDYVAPKQSEAPSVQTNRTEAPRVEDDELTRGTSRRRP